MTEQTITSDALLDELVEAATAFATCPNPPDPQTPDEWMAQSKWRDARDRLREARTAVAALIARNAALEAELKQYERALTFISEGDQRPGHVNHITKGRMATLAREALSAADAIDAARAEAGHG